MDYLTEEDMKELPEDEEVVHRLTELMAMGDAAYFRGMCSHLSSEGLEECLNENPDEGIYLKK